VEGVELAFGYPPYKIAWRTLLSLFPSPISTNPCSGGGAPGAVNPRSPTQLVELLLPHLSVYWTPGVKPKLWTSVWSCASGAKGSRPPFQTLDCGFCPATATADTANCFDIPGSTGIKLSGTLAEAVTRRKR